MRSSTTGRATPGGGLAGGPVVPRGEVVEGELFPIVLDLAALD